MKFFIIFLACMMTASVNATPSEEKLSDLDSLRWKYRVILIFANEPHISNALANLDELSAEIKDRDIAWFVLGENALHTNYDGQLEDDMREQLVGRYFTPEPTGTAVLLIGKDGTIKSRGSDLDLEATFGLIDRMPMRRAEIRRRGDNPD